MNIRIVTRTDHRFHGSIGTIEDFSRSKTLSKVFFFLLFLNERNTFDFLEKGSDACIAISRVKFWIGFAGGWERVGKGRKGRDEIRAAPSNVNYAKSLHERRRDTAQRENALAAIFRCFFLRREIYYVNSLLP